MNSLSLLEEITQVIQKWELIYLRLNLSFTTNPIHIQGFHKTTEHALENGSKIHQPIAQLCHELASTMELDMLGNSGARQGEEPN